MYSTTTCRGGEENKRIGSPQTDAETHAEACAAASPGLETDEFSMM